MAIAENESPTHHAAEPGFGATLTFRPLAATGDHRDFARLSQDRGGMLVIPPHVMREHSPPLATVLHLKMRQMAGVRRAGLRFRFVDRGRVADAYDSMTPEQFRLVNEPQVWIETRQLPRVLSARVPKLGASIVDLGCGPGTSTAIIARYADPTWTIWGIDLSATLIGRARERVSRGEFVSGVGGEPVTIRPRFFNQSMTEPWVSGQLIADESIDLVNSSGVVGHHLSEEDVRAVLHEARRVLKPGSFLALDSGPRIGPRTLSRLMAESGFIDPRLIRAYAFDLRPKVVAQKVA